MKAIVTMLGSAVALWFTIAPSQAGEAWTKLTARQGSNTTIVVLDGSLGAIVEEDDGTIRIAQPANGNTVTIIQQPSFGEDRDLPARVIIQAGKGK